MTKGSRVAVLMAQADPPGPVSVKRISKYSGGECRRSIPTIRIFGACEARALPALPDAVIVVVRPKEQPPLREPGLMDTIRRATPNDAAACGRICFDAFAAINDAHGFPRDFPSVDVAAGLLRMLLEHPGFYGVVAERDGTVIGSNFLDERSTIVGIGPISVDPAVQNQGVGRRLMRDVIDRAASRLTRPVVAVCVRPPSIAVRCVSTRQWDSARVSHSQS